MRLWLKSLAPAPLRRWWRNRTRWHWLRGDFSTWAEARRHATGADGAAQLARVRAATREVVAGRAAWERDGVAFAEPAVHLPLLAALRQAAGAGSLGVVDFGGGLGSTWRQHRPALAGVPISHWAVVELPALVALGREEFAEGPLSFHATIADALGTQPPQVILFSSVLNYLERPAELLVEAVTRGFPDVILDRVPVLPASARDRLAVQHTPPALGGGSHPCWLFSPTKLAAALPGYELAAEWAVPFDPDEPPVTYRGYHFRRRKGGAA